MEFILDLKIAALYLLVVYHQAYPATDWGPGEPPFIMGADLIIVAFDGECKFSLPEWRWLENWVYWPLVQKRLEEQDEAFAKQMQEEQDHFESGSHSSSE